MRIDFVERQTDFLLVAELAGVSKDQVEVKIEADAVTIETTKPFSHTGEGDNYMTRERSFGPIKRSIALPREVDSSKAHAAFQDGLLSITFPKKIGGATHLKKLAIH